MNPYDFVRVDWENPPKRRGLVGHNTLDGLHGTVKCRLIAETPLFVPDPPDQNKRQNPNAPREFLQNNEGKYFIQGSSLKGMLRSVVETVGPGCWALFGGKHQKRLPREFSRCNNSDRLCPACRLFGVVNGKMVHYRGRVGVDDAICDSPISHDPIYTIILSNPKPDHEPWYLTDGKVAGRKYYFHQGSISTLDDWKESGAGKKQNQYITPLHKDSAFTFQVVFQGLDNEELALLLYALFLEDNMRHKIGSAKPAGLGSVKIEPEEMTLIDFRSRYKDRSEPTILDGDRLKDYIKEKTAIYRENDSITMQDLRRIWHWPPHYERCAYSSQEWFSKHGAEPISKT
jgi:CRISPR/Cas system CSM-associated protein Csm3 (group 7 of RAMP superfamily)